MCTARRSSTPYWPSSASIMEDEAVTQAGRRRRAVDDGGGGPALPDATESRPPPPKEEANVEDPLRLPLGWDNGRAVVEKAKPADERAGVEGEEEARETPWGSPPSPALLLRRAR